MTHLGASGMWPHAEVVNLTHKGVIAQSLPPPLLHLQLLLAPSRNGHKWRQGLPSATGRILYV